MLFTKFQRTFINLQKVWTLKAAIFCVYSVCGWCCLFFCCLYVKIITNLCLLKKWILDKIVRCLLFIWYLLLSIIDKFIYCTSPNYSCWYLIKLENTLPNKCINHVFMFSWINIILQLFTCFLQEDWILKKSTNVIKLLEIKPENSLANGKRQQKLGCFSYFLPVAFNRSFWRGPPRRFSMRSLSLTW